jgi:1-phosphatidylinositol phosphodiesterase
MKVFSNKIALINNSSAIIDEVQILDTVHATPGLAPGDSWLGESGADAVHRRALYADGALRLKTDGSSDFLTGERDARRTTWTFRRPGGGGLRAGVQVQDDIGEQWLYLSLSDEAESPADWMRDLPDGTLLSEISMPGTNHSASYSVFEGMVQHQSDKMDIAQQLAAGIRFLHLEVDIDGDRFTLRDEGVPLPVSLEDVLKTIGDFLGEHRGEAVSVLLKSVVREVMEPTATLSFADVFLGYYEAAPDLWYLKGSIPTLRDVRGKIILWRGFYNDPLLNVYPLGIDADAWEENSAGFTYDLSNPTDPSDPTGGSVYVQNLYNIRYPWNIENKFLVAKKALIQSAAAHPSRLYVNYFGAAGINDQAEDANGPARYTPLDMAEGYTFENMVHEEGDGLPPKVLTYPGVNELLEADLDQYIHDAQQQPPPRAIFVLDYASAPLCEKIIQLNFPHSGSPPAAGG